ncbi:hypothetical protein [Jiulongibacter sp. NS-SX5]|uniref:hypothetical protein n=1 Tax=Jiulongibacter sp. NS-SX5 TaxID=3463854 RepID=UPI0040597596
MPDSKISLIVLFTLFYLQAFLSFAQDSQSLLNSPGQNWQKIENEKTTVVFPKGIEGQAKRVARILDVMAKGDKSSIGEKVLHAPIILHTQSMEPNGFVSTAPFRSEFYPLGIPNWNIMGPNNWTTLLAIHEYRHVLQASNTVVGVTKLAKIITGQFGWGAVNSFSRPSWFSEGDAVITESLYTETGRGRMPSFSMEQRAFMEEGVKIRYTKARQGSFKTQIPNHYPFGYQMSLYARAKYGNDVWAEIQRDASQYDRIFYPFGGAMKKNIGLRPKKLYKEAYAELKKEYDDLKSEREFSELKNITERQKTVSYYSYPFESEIGFVARKSTYKETPYLVFIEDGKEEKLTDIGHSDNAFISYNKQKAVWVENRPHPFYENQDFQRVIVYDFLKDQKTTVLDGKRVFFAAINKANSQIAAIEFDTQMQFHLRLYDLKSEELVKEFPLDLETEYAYPVFDDKDSKRLYMAAKRDGRQRWMAFSLSNGEEQGLTESYAHAMVEPFQTDDKIYVRASFDGIDNIYAFDKNGDKQLYRASSVPVAAGFPMVKNKELIFANYHTQGNNLVKTKLELTPVSVENPTEMAIYKRLNSLEENQLLLSKIPDKTYKVSKYNSAIGGWKFHSWGIIPAFGDDFDNGYLGLSEAAGFVRMDNLLSTQRLNLNYTYYPNSAESQYGFDYSIAAFMPIIQIGYSFRQRSVPAFRGDRLIEFNEQEAHAGVRVPISTVKNNYSFSTNLTAFWRGTQPFFQNGVSSYYNEAFGALDLGGSIAVLRRQAYQNLQPRLGLSASAGYYTSLQDGIAEKSLYSATVYLPGIGRNHGVRLSGVRQFEALSNTYQLPDNLTAARGYPIAGLEKTERVSANYQLPLLYPDLGINGLTYFRRLRANLFYDNARISDSVVTTSVHSAGVELMLDQTLFNVFSIPVGARFGYRFENELVNYDSPFFIDFIFGN